MYRMSKSRHLTKIYMLQNMNKNRCASLVAHNQGAMSRHDDKTTLHKKYNFQCLATFFNTSLDFCVPNDYAPRISIN